MRRSFAMEKKLTIKKRGSTYMLAMDQIIYLENSGRLVIAHTGFGEIGFYGSLARVMDELDDRFVMCHRSYAINMECVTLMKEKQICFNDGSIIYMGRDTYKKTKKLILNYLNAKHT